MPERSYTYYDFTISLCPHCLKRIDAKIVFEEGCVYLLKHCAEHGFQKVLIATDVEYYKSIRNYNKPSEMPLRFNTKTLAANCFKASPNTRERTNTQHQAKLEGTNDARTGMPHGIPRGAMCVQRFDDSLNSAIHITYRISLRSSSMPEPRDPLLKVVIIKFFRR